MELINKLLIIFTVCSVSFVGNFEKVLAATLNAISESAVVNQNNNNEVLFTINFNRTPNFLLTDEFGRQADSFQYFIEADGEFPIWRGSPYYSELDAIVRGEEIHVSGNIRFRKALPSSSDPNSGGWGDILGSVPYTLNGNTVSFSAPPQLFGDSDGFFSYGLLWTEFGGSGGFIKNKSLSSKEVHEPASMLGILTFAAFSASLLIKQKQTTNNVR
ncbi:hypothetical protein NIES2101_43295 [Calothrix sp. HK-06]|nr:hypothetical protein NIES2101_43295 [Calothrix sp. HK-06]